MLNLERLGWEGENPQRVVVPNDDNDNNGCGLTEAESRIDTTPSQFTTSMENELNTRKKQWFCVETAFYNELLKER